MAISSASDSAGLLFRISADSSQASAEIKKIVSEVTGMGDKTVEAMEKVLGSSTLVIGALAGVTLAVVGVTKALFNLAEQASEYGSQIHDAAQKTGITTDSVQALKFAAEQSGSSFEAVSGAVAKFSVLLGDAKNQNEKALATLKQYHITTTDTDAALKQAIQTIASMTDHDQKAAAAKALFRDRAAAILPVIESFDGDLPGLIKHLKDLGVIMSTEDTDAADAFGDQMDTLGTQFTHVKIALGSGLMPVFTAWAAELSDWLKSNPGEIKAWGETFVTILQAIGNAVQILTTDLQVLNEWSSNLINTDKYYQLLDKLAVLEQKDKNFWAGKNILPGQTNVNGQPDELKLGPPKPAPTTVDPEAEKKAQDEAKKLEQERLQSLRQYYRSLVEQTKLAYETTTKIQKDAFENGRLTEDQYRKQAQAVRTAAFNKTKQQIEAQAEADKQLAKNDIDRKTVQINKEKAIAALRMSLKEDQLKVDKNVSEYEDQISQAEKKVHELEMQQVREQIAVLNQLLDAWREYDTTIADVLSRVNSELTKWDNINKETAALVRANIAAIGEQLDLEADAQRKALENTIENGLGPARLRALEQLRDLDLSEAKRRRDQRVSDLNEEQRVELDGFKGTTEQKILLEDLYDKKRLLTEEQFQQSLLDIKKKFADEATVLQGETAGGGFFGGLASGLGTSINNMLQAVQPLAALGNIIGQSFMQMAQGVGAAVRAFVLMGSAGTSFRKFAAEMIASVAQMAAVQAIWEAAQALAMAALFWFTGNPDYLAASGAHTGAAILYGAIAGVAAAIGRSVAGDTFKQQSGAANGNSAAGGGSGGGSANPGQFYSSNPDATIEEGRTQPGRGGLGTIVIRVESNDSHILKVVKKNVSLNGVLRTEVAG